MTTIMEQTKETIVSDFLGTKRKVATSQQIKQFNEDHIVLHETEFLSFTIFAINQMFNSEGLGAVINHEPLILSDMELITGVSEKVWFHLIDFYRGDLILSLIDSSVGRIEFAKQALALYGIHAFAALWRSPGATIDLGKGYFAFGIC